ncbi:MAG: hypothetical protein ABSE59_01110 [Opitutaceae bacterium]|jgi:LAS superfamily LD-carboxypeptidase LdcB
MIVEPESGRSSSLPQIWAELGIPADYAARYRFSLKPEAIQLIRIGTTANGRELLLTPPAATAWKQMLQAAVTDKITLQVVSALILREHSPPNPAYATVNSNP